MNPAGFLLAGFFYLCLLKIRNLVKFRYVDSSKRTGGRFVVFEYHKGGT